MREQQYGLFSCNRCPGRSQGTLPVRSHLFRKTPKDCLECGEFRAERGRPRRADIPLSKVSKAFFVPSQRLVEVSPRLIEPTVRMGALVVLCGEMAFHQAPPAREVGERVGSDDAIYFRGPFDSMLGAVPGAAPLWVHSAVTELRVLDEVRAPEPAVGQPLCLGNALLKVLQAGLWDPYRR